MMDIKFVNDIEIVNGDLAMVDEPQASGQRIRHRLLTFRGEWFLDLGFGVPYRENILVRNPRLDVIGAIFRSEILKSAAGEFTDFSASIDNQTRRLTLSFSLQTTQGNVSDTVII